MQLSKLFAIIISLYFINSFAQTNQHYSIGLESNSQYYVDDDVTGDFLEENQFRSNNYLKLEYGIANFTFGVQAESYAPQHLLNYSPSYDQSINIGTYFASYTRKKWDMTLGYFYGQFGNGLIYRSWEDRQLGINNAIRGAKVSFRPTDKIELTALYGNQRVGFKVSEGSIAGFDSNFDLSTENITLQLGAGFINRSQDIISDNNDFKPDTQAYSGRVQFAKNNFYSNFEGVVKSKDALVAENTIYDNSLFYGNALLLELGYSQKGFGLNATLRRLENMNFYSNREAMGNLYNEQIVNYLPGLTKQHDYLLSNIYVYQAQSGIVLNFSQDNNSPQQKSGEVGGQIDIYYKIKKGTPLGGKYGTKLAFNFSNWYGLDTKYITEYQRMEVNFFGIGKQYFRDANIEVRKKFSKKTSGILTYINSSYNQEVIEQEGGIVKMNVLVAEATYKLKPKQSVRLEAQHLWAKGDFKEEGNWAAGTAEFNVNSNLSFYINDMYNYGNTHKDENDEIHKDHYYNIGGSFSKNKSRFALSWGRTRGGLLCVGGVCRIVPAATGLTFNVTTSF